MDALDRRIINELQGGFPVCEYPFREMAQRLGSTECELITRLGCMLEDGLLTMGQRVMHISTDVARGVIILMIYLVLVPLVVWLVRRARKRPLRGEDRTSGPAPAK